MIDKEEILIAAKKESLDPSIIEKDYVIGWLLRGIYHMEQIRDIWIFKGGTAIKKCYFNEYRFSEDLDFSLLNTDQENLPNLQEILLESVEWVHDLSGIEISPAAIEIDVYKTPLGWDAIQAKLTYNGPLRRKTNFPRIKLDLTFHEKIVLEPEKRNIFHPYSDLPKENIQARCYPFEELFAEKIRALAERTRPRDIYDVIHFYQSRRKLKSKKLLLQILEEKCKFKRIPLPSLQAIQSRLDIENLNSEWQRMLAHQLPKLNLFEESWALMPTIFDWLYDKNIQENP
ncbi:MAG TPA: nucleotidyl transferase AbiEii/AbiGii toxin family protein [Rhabdochlamydiaceae bacterium]|nr:nucleotidyl transferase AbiEii/AbiGii toxin family protein [Rhabdochlamydiaceae bacterium]